MNIYLEFPAKIYEGCWQGAKQGNLFQFVKVYKPSDQFYEENIASPTPGPNEIKSLNICKVKNVLFIVGIVCCNNGFKDRVWSLVIQSKHSKQSWTIGPGDHSKRWIRGSFGLK